MRQAAHQLLGGLLLGVLLQLLADLLLLIDLAQFYHHQSLFMIGHGTDADLHQPGLPLHHQGDFAVGEALPRNEALFETLQIERDVFQQVGQFDADQPSFAEGKQLLCRRVDELNAETFIHENDGGQQVVQECLGVVRAGWHRFLPKTVLYT